LKLGLKKLKLRLRFIIIWNSK